MAIPKKILFLDSIILSFFLRRLAPQYTLYQSIYWTIAALYFAQLFVLATWGIVIYPLFLSPLRHLPQPTGMNPIMGVFGRIIREPAGAPQREYIDEIPNDGVIYYRSHFNDPRILVTTPKALAEVLVHRNYEFVKPKMMIQGLARVLGVGILLAEGDEHKRQRRLLMPAFAFRHVKDLYPVFWNKSREMVEAMSAAIKAPNPSNEKPSSIQEINEWASRATLDIIGVAGLGKDFNAVQTPDNELNQTYRRIFTTNKIARAMQMLGNFLPIWLLRALPMKRNEEIRDAIKLIKKTAHDLVVSKREKLEKGGRSDVDILSVAMESGGFSDDDLTNQLMTFLAAGHETTASALTWASYLLCLNPEAQKRLREEVRAALPSINDPNAKISSTEIDHLAYLNAVVNETMRIYPPVPLTLRETAHDTTICGHFIPKGTPIVLCPWAVNTSKAMWGDDAREFNPDRWMAQGRANTGGAESNYSYMTFLHGPRSCIGKDFAKAEFACLLAALIGRFEIELADPNYKLDIQGGVTMKPADGLKVRIREVEGW